MSILEKDAIIGIVGGMGPESGLALFNDILCHSNATTDQTHLSVILMSFPKYIVDRTLFLEGLTTINPAFNIIEVIRKLENAGAKVVGIACNTSHSPQIYKVILEELDKANSQVRLINMPFETCMYIKRNHPHIRRVGIMTTNGAYKSGLYNNMLKDIGYEVIIPKFRFQNDIIHKMIYDQKFGIKSNPNTTTKMVKQFVNKALNFFKKNGAEAVILGCTELSLVLTKKVVNDMFIIDSTECLAKALIREATVYQEETTATTFKNTQLSVL